MPATQSPLPPAFWHDISCEWLWVYHGLAPERAEWSPEIPVPAGVFFVESGHVSIRADAQEFHIGPGQAFFSAPGIRQQTFAPKTRLLSVGMRCLWPDGQPVYSAGLNTVFATPEIQTLHQATESLFKTVHPAANLITYAMARTEKPRSLSAWVQHDAAYWEWFSQYVQILEKHDIHPASRTAPSDRRLQQLRHWLQSWPLNLALNLDEVAAGLSLTPRRVHDLLRRDLGMTAQGFLEKRRLEKARERLAQEDTPLKEIAFALGFRHPPHFTTWFRKHTGMTPTAYRSSGLNDGA